MKISKKIQIYILGIIVFVMTGCNSHLDIPMYNNIVGDGFWNSPTDAELYAVGVLTKIIPYGYDVGSGDARTDAIGPGDSAPIYTGAMESHTQSAVTGTGSWVGYYNTIFHCNLLIQKTNEMTFTDQKQKDRILGIGYFARAYTYFQLLRKYGEVPLIFEPFERKPEVEDYPARSPVADVMTQVKLDVEAAVNGLPVGIADKNFISKAAALALKADVYMWSARAFTKVAITADLNTAIAAIDAIPTASNATVSFETDMTLLYPLKASDAKEYIWARYYDYTVGPKNNIFNYYGMWNSAVPEWYKGKFPHCLQSEGNITASIRPELIPIFLKYDAIVEYINPYDTNTVVSLKEKVKWDHRYKDFTIDVLQNGNLYPLCKFPGEIVVAENKRYWTNDLPIYRWSDMLLLKAEALNVLGGRTAEVVEIMNMTRKRAGLADYPGAIDKETLEDEILDERARELLAENKRWFDLIRAHKVSKYVERFKTNRGDDSADEQVWRYYYWPIAASTLSRNDKLEQTAGY